MDALTARAVAPGGPGPIVNIPVFDFTLFKPGSLQGRYHIGIACSLLNRTSRFWSSDVVFNDAPTDAPAHLKWELVASARNAGGNHVLGTLLAFGAIVAAAILWLVLRRRGTQWTR